MDPNQPSGPAAPTATGPAASGADANQSTTLTFDSFSDEEKKYLAGQGVTSQEQLTADALRKVINHAQASQKTAAERDAELQKLRNGMGASGPTGSASGASGATGTPSSTPTSDDATGLDPVQAFQLTHTLVGQFPKLADKLKDGSFYTEMANDGFNVSNGKGGVNLDALLKYAKFANKQAELSEKEAELNKPGAIPDPNGTTPNTLDSKTPMTLAIAQNIVLQDKTNERYDEARKYIEDNANKKK